MKNKPRPPRSERTVKKATLLIALAIGLAFSVFVIGVAGVSIGLGSLYPPLNLVAKPFVCPSGEMTHRQQSSQVGSATYHTAQWYCANDGKQALIEPSSIYWPAGVMYGLAVFAAIFLITHVYWYSSIGPAKNDGLRLW